MKTLILSLAAAFALASCGTMPAPPADSAIKAAVADARRPSADVARDVNRKPAETLRFSGVKPGDKVGELLPGGGYFTRMLSDVVGPEGHVYAIVNPPPPPSSEPAAPDAPRPGPPAVAAVANDYANVSVLAQNFTALAPPEKLDLVWTSQNYHDLHLSRLHVDVGAVNEAVYDALKPGGTYLVLDHAAAPGSGLRDPDKLHRIDPAVVKQEVEAAGFVFVGQSNVLANPADDHAKPVFDPAIRGKTDQFIFKFKKPE
jgi:predicted methyltransferase